MKKSKTNLPPVNPYSNDGYDDDNIPEIDLPKATDAGTVIPDEMPHRNGPVESRNSFPVVHKNNSTEN